MYISVDIHVDDMCLCVCVHMGCVCACECAYNSKWIDDNVYVMLHVRVVLCNVMG